MMKQKGYFFKRTAMHIHTHTIKKSIKLTIKVFNLNKKHLHHLPRDMHSGMVLPDSANTNVTYNDKLTTNTILNKIEC